MTKIEEVARAICCPSGVCRSEQNADPRYFFLLPCNSLIYQEEARAVIAVLREPSEAMLDAGEQAAYAVGILWSPEPGEGLDGVDPTPIWHAMIDVLLAERP